MREFKIEYRNEITGDIWDTMFDTVAADTEEEAIELAKQWFIDNGEDADEIMNDWSFKASDVVEFEKFYAYYQENYGEEKFELRDHEEKIIVIAAPSEGDARAAFVRIIDEQIRAIGNEPEETDMDFIVVECSENELCYNFTYYAEYSYNDI